MECYPSSRNGILKRWARNTGVMKFAAPGLQCLQQVLTDTWKQWMFRTIRLPNISHTSYWARPDENKHRGEILWSFRIQRRWKIKSSRANGSIQNITEIPDELKEITTVWEIKQRSLIDMLLIAGAYLPKSESEPVYPGMQISRSFHINALLRMEKGLKTGNVLPVF